MTNWQLQQKTKSGKNHVQQQNQCQTKQSKPAQEPSVVMMSREAAGERCCCCFLPFLSSLVVVVVVAAPVASIVHSTLAYT